MTTTKSKEIFVIEKEYSNRIKIKGSQFLGFAYKIESQGDFSRKLTSLKKRLYDASHHCYAYRLESGEDKYSDDGEPNGTAGIRILNAINHFSLTNILLVVVRYFGGTKLGIGPLGKAYGETAMDLLTSADIIKLTQFEKILIEYEYNDLSSIHFLMNKFKCGKITNIYDSNPKISCAIEPYLIITFQEELIEKTAGRSKITKDKNQLYLRLNQ